MPEWWTYTFSDFLLFSPRTYYRLIERYNEAIWPGQVVTVGLGLVIAVLVRRPAPHQGRIVSAILAALWTWVAWAFLWQRYAAINWPVTYLVWLFAIEVLLLVWIGVVRGGLSLRWSRAGSNRRRYPRPAASGGGSAPLGAPGGAAPLVPGRWRDLVGDGLARGVGPDIGRAPDPCGIGR